MSPPILYFRFPVKKMLTAVAVCALLFLVFLRPPPSSWVGEAQVRIRVQLVESTTGSAVSNAVVVMSHPRRGSFSGNSDVYGIAELVIPCGLGGTNFLSHTKAYVDCRFWNVEVRLANGLSVSRELSSHTGDFVTFDGSDVPRMTIRFVIESLRGARETRHERERV